MGRSCHPPSATTADEAMLVELAFVFFIVILSMFDHIERDSTGFIIGLGSERSLAVVVVLVIFISCSQSALTASP